MSLYLTEDDVKQVMTMKDTIEALEIGFKDQGEGLAVNKPRERLRVPMGSMQIMSASVPSLNVVGFKAYTATRGGVRFLVYIHSADTGQLLSIIEASRLGQLRTGAASGVATKYLAKNNAGVVGVYGTGYQAQGQVEAICEVMQVKRMQVYGRDQAKREDFCRRMSEITGVEIVPVSDPQAAAKGADVIVTITTSREPVFKGEWVEPGMHINAAGANNLLRREIDDDVVRKCTLLTADSVEQAKMECADLLQPVERGIINWEQVRELGYIVAGLMPGRKTDDDVTLFESHGIAIWDVASATRCYELAKTKGIGQEMPM